jgi:hypothetical protein
MNDTNDDLGEFLTPKPAQPSSELREKLLRRTESRLVRQRWVDRGIRIGVIAAIFLVGGLTGWLIRLPFSPATPEVAEPEVVFIPVPVVLPVDQTENSSTVRNEAIQILSGSHSELQAEQADDPRDAARLYKLAGDAFLREQDYSNATRCYRIHLLQGGDTALSLTPEDSWLLTSLKNAAFQEKSRVQKSDG